MLPCPHLQESLDDTVGVEVSEARLALQALGVYPVTIDLGQVVHTDSVLPSPPWTQCTPVEVLLVEGGHGSC